MADSANQWNKQKQTVQNINGVVQRAYQDYLKWQGAVFFVQTVRRGEEGIEGGEIGPPTYNPCRTWDSNPRPSGYKSNSLTIRPRLPLHLTLSYAGYTPQDNRADFEPISPLPTILGNVPIILVVLDFPVVWGVLRVTESARKNVGGAPIANRKYSTCWIFTIRNPDVWGEPRGQRHVWSADYHVKWNNIQSESELTEDGSITNTVMAQHKSIWTAEMEDQLVDLWQQQECLYNVSCKTYLFSSRERFCEVSHVHSRDS